MDDFYEFSDFSHDTVSFLEKVFLEIYKKAKNALSQAHVKLIPGEVPNTDEGKVLRAMRLRINEVNLIFSVTELIVNNKNRIIEN